MDDNSFNFSASNLGSKGEVDDLAALQQGEDVVPNIASMQLNMDKVCIRLCLSDTLTWCLIAWSHAVTACRASEFPGSWGPLSLCFVGLQATGMTPPDEPDAMASADVPNRGIILIGESTPEGLGASTLQLGRRSVVMPTIGLANGGILATV